MILYVEYSNRNDLFSGAQTNVHGFGKLNEGSGLMPLEVFESGCKFTYT